MKKILTIALLFLATMSMSAQTKKIAHKKAGFFETTVMLNSLDNFGAIMISDAEMQQMQELQLENELKIKEAKEKERQALILKSVKKEKKKKIKADFTKKKTTLVLNDSLVLNPEMIKVFGDSVQAKNPQKILKSSDKSTYPQKMKAKKSELPWMLFYVSTVLFLLNIYRRELKQSRV